MSSSLRHSATPPLRHFVTPSLRHPVTSSPAFTLIELIIASLMLAILLTATYAAVGQVTRARDRSLARAQAHQRAALAADLIAADARQALRDADLYYARIAIINSRPAARGQDGLLLFTHISRPIRPRSGQNEGAECESQFRLEPNPRTTAGAGMTLWRRRQPIPDEHPDSGGVAAALVDGLQSLSIDAYDGAAWTNVWDSDNDGFPHALRLTVVGADDAGHATATARRVIAFDRTPPPRAYDDTTDAGTSGTNASP